jgi:hypothetical protein
MGKNGSRHCGLSSASVFIIVLAVIAKGASLCNAIDNGNHKRVAALD